MLSAKRTGLTVDDLDQPAELVFYCPECPERGSAATEARAGAGLRIHPAPPNLHHWSDGLLCLRTGHAIMNTSKKATIRETCGARTLGPHGSVPGSPPPPCSIALWRGYVAGQFYLREPEGGAALAFSPTFRIWRFPWQERKPLDEDAGCRRRFGGAQGRSDFKRVGTYAARLRLRMVRASLPVARV